MTIGDGIRRNVATITAEERNRLRDAFRKLDNQMDPSVLYPDGVTYWDKQEQVHKAAHTAGQDVHGGPAFLAWHRELCNRLEVLLRQVDPQLSLHYWDWTTDPRATPDGAGGVVNLFTDQFMGHDQGDAGAPFTDFESTEDAELGNGHTVIWRDLPAGGPAMTADLDQVVNFNNAAAADHDVLAAADALPPDQQFGRFDDVLQGVHNYIHSGYIRGTIGDAHYSFHDPFVFLLHSNVDRLWAMWQRDPHNPWRLDPNQSYGNQGSAATINSPMEPWAGSAGLSPWTAAGGQIDPKTAKDASVILPPSYDIAPHTSFIVTDRDVFSSYEVEATPNYPRALYVIYDGFAPQELGSPVAPPALGFTFDTAGGAVVPGLSASYRQVDFEDPARALDVPQRITFTFDLHFADATIFNTFAETRDVNLRATGGAQSADARLHLIKQPNPYLLDGPVSWLSTDLRVFQMRPGMVRAGVQQHDQSADSAAPYHFIQDLLTTFNSQPNDEFHPFRDISEDQQTSALELSRSVNGQRVYNYAVAKVRYRANAVPATNVKVFFRAFSTLVSALDYNTNTNYRRAGVGDNAIPLLGMQGDEIAAIPFFAEPRIDSTTQDMSSQPDTTNRHTINAAVGQESDWYFGCWLDFNQTAPQFPLHPSGDGHFSGRLPIMQLIRGHHQCLVAEIFFQPDGTDPIPAGATPSSSDRLAQRNLAIIESDNPGGPATHTVQHTFMVKPSTGRLLQDAVLVAAANERAWGFDELMITWNNLPRDTRATIYLPEVESDQIVAMANLRQRPAGLEKVNQHTLSCKVADISYLPLPGGRGKNLAGLLTLELPQGIKDGQFFTVDVHQYAGYNHKILGGFQLAIPVRLGTALLPKELQKLAVLRYVAQGIPLGDRWYPIFVRYLKQIEDKVRGLGGDPDTVKPSPDGTGGPTEQPCPPSKPRLQPLCALGWLVAAWLAYIITRGHGRCGPGCRVYVGRCCRPCDCDRDH